MDDSVIIQFLLETAIGDSQHYSVLSHEHVDAIKKELSILSTRIDGTRRKLLLETKLRDAAQSLNRLRETPEPSDGSPRSPKRHRRSLMGSRGSLSDALNKTDDELASSTRKCNDLAKELWGLEKREDMLQKMSLEHTAAVLQRAHRVSCQKDGQPSQPNAQNGFPHEPDTYKLFDLTDDFPEGSFLRTLDSFLDSSGVRDNGEVPIKRLSFSQQNQAIAETERKLESLNCRLHKSIAQLRSSSGVKPVPAAKGLENEHNPMSVLDDQLLCLEENLVLVQDNQKASTQQANQISYYTEERLSYFNTQLRQIIAQSFHRRKSEYPSPPAVGEEGYQGQIDYLEAGLDTIRQEIQHLLNDHDALSSQTASHESKAEQYDAVLLGLWEILVGGEEESRRQNPLQREAGGEDFSLQAFSAKVQTLFAQATGLQEQKEILTRQVQQQRELNSNSDPQKDLRFSDVSDELERTKQSLVSKEGELKEARDHLVLMSGRVDAMQEEASLLEQKRVTEKGWAQESREGLGDGSDEKRLSTEIEAKQRRIADLENELAETKDDWGISNAEMLGRLEEAEKQIHVLNNELEGFRIEKENHYNELQDMEGQMIHLQTELTVARAELDGAYGTRAQRAAEQASNPAKQQEFNELTLRNQSLVEELEGAKTRQQSAEHANNDLSQRIQTLQRELTETIGEYESMTRASIEFEREREQLESNLDTLRDRCESAESQLSEEKVRWLGVRSPGNNRDSISPGTTSTQVLKNEFKKMMRDTRAEHMRALRVGSDG